MKYLKKYDNIKYSDVKIGDYVLVKDNAEIYHFMKWNNYSDFIYFVSNHIGEVLVVFINDRIRVGYDNIPLNIRTFFHYDKENGYFINIDLENVFMTSNNKKDLEAVINSKKYNI